jgi:3',5'-cyclic-AMP phosphodiesterase
MIRRYGSILLSIIAVIIVSSQGIGKGDYYRIVVLSDPHLPTKTKNVEKKQNREKVLKAKESVINDINGWSDVDRVAMTGDLSADYSSDEEFTFASDFLKRLKPPLSVVTGNHDYFYIKNEEDDTRFSRGTPETRKEKLDRFAKVFGMKSLSYTVKIDGYLLVFLSIDELTGKYSVRLSKKTIDWFKSTVGKNKKIPTIVFCHAPLDNTLQAIDEKDKGSAFIEPKKEIDAIIKDNPQIFVWVSGHTHTAPDNPGFMADYNLYKEQVMDIQNNDMDQETIWTNSLFIYKDRVEVKTYNHKTEKYDTKFDRKILLPALK